MSMLNCRECAQPISSSAAACPHCGAPKKRGFPLLKFVLLVFFALFLLSAIRSYNFYRWQSESHALQERAQQTLAAIPDHPNEPPRETWKVNQYEDKMTGEMVNRAALISDNKLQFEFPYNGGVRGAITIFTKKTASHHVQISIEKGQFLCSIDRCEVTARFDEGKARKFTGSPPTDNSSDLIILLDDDGERFYQALKKSKSAKVQTLYYRGGNQILEFSSANLPL